MWGMIVPWLPAAAESQKAASLFHCCLHEQTSMMGMKKAPQMEVRWIC